MWINPGEVWQYLNTIVKLRTVLSGPKLDRSDGSSLHSESHLSRSIQFTQSQVFEDFAPAAPHLFTAGDFFCVSVSVPGKSVATATEWTYPDSLPAKPFVVDQSQVRRLHLEALSQAHVPSW